ncbi:hypothetical protein Patl1_08585 [Pistacia atlantica]|uniref:Uncharacterized protein n=1 Tax=Pistacia atlantica TaxID=434234 RepID=A0ACC1AEX2_9ROSI|nr:hypothetical protein Patl1_08585 [Pistacia atlantica]
MGSCVSTRTPKKPNSAPRMIFQGKRAPDQLETKINRNIVLLL